jgi:hypothetical protein
LEDAMKRTPEQSVAYTNKLLRIIIAVSGVCLLFCTLYGIFH